MKRAVTFYVLAVALGVLAALPLWFDPRGLKAPYLATLALGMMWTPAIAAYICLRATRAPRPFADLLALRKPAQSGVHVLLAIALPLLFSIGAIALGTFFGVYDYEPPRSALAALGMLAVVIPAGFVNALPALGEEIGWRGYLLNELRDWPPLPADVLIGVVWGLWHAPLILLGYNYPTAPVLGAFVLMPSMCVLLSIWIGWLRRRSNSTWIAALAHGASNASATLALAMHRHDAAPDTVHATITGWSGWLLPAAFALWLAWTGRTAARRSAPQPHAA